MKRKVLVIGANGALGTDLVKTLGDAVPAVHADFDISDKRKAAAFIKASGVNVVINTAAFHQVPLCETEHERAFQVNVIGARNLAEVCTDFGLHLCHLSTDYVFDGKAEQPYSEADLPAPLNMYGISKLAGEYAVAAYCADYSIVRSCGLYGRVPTRAKGGNFINTMMRLGREREVVTVVDDEIVSPTCTTDLAQGINALLDAEGRGTFHISQTGSTSWYEFARVIFDFFSLPAVLKPIPAKQLQTSVRRPPYSILDNRRFESLTGFKMPPWREALERHLNTFKRPETS